MNEPILTYPNSREFSLRPETESSVAIVMRTKDRPVLLVRAICSVINQNFTDWHLFIVNDGGDPAALEETIKPYWKKLEGKVSIINNKDSTGMEAASNAAVSAILEFNSARISSGVGIRHFSFCVIHDDDDSWYPEFLSETVSFLRNEENSRIGGVCTQVTVVEEKMHEDSVWYLKEYPYVPHFCPDNFWEMLKRNQSVPIAFLFRTEMIDMSGYFNSGLPVLGDWDFFLRFFLHADIGFIDKPLAYYHQRVGLVNDPNGNSVIAKETLHQNCLKKYEAAIYRKSVGENSGAFGILFALANFEKRLGDVNWWTNEKLDNVNREIGVLHWKLDRILQVLNVGNYGIPTKKKKTLLKKIDSFFYQNLFKHVLKLFNIPPPEQKKSFIKRLDSFLYQLFFRHLLNLFKK
ncbi:MAG: glycosyltransferase [Puniceicoccales bacterium]|jgi:glycosyltransferase involved in cell wall biosynthesis|nr:glycosyltransferase [Puniceicoccales bacterium]